MTNEFKLIFILGLIIFSLTALLKVLNYLYNRRRSTKIYNSISTHINLLQPEASHEKYIKISRKRSVSNKPIRQSGDFMDFVLPYINDNDNVLENQLASLDCGESDYE